MHVGVKHRRPFPGVMTRRGRGLQRLGGMARRIRRTDGPARIADGGAATAHAAPAPHVRVTRQAGACVRRAATDACGNDVVTG